MWKGKGVRYSLTCRMRQVSSLKIVLLRDAAAAGIYAVGIVVALEVGVGGELRGLTLLGKSTRV